jgi:hypothetical protein
MTTKQKAPKRVIFSCPDCGSHRLQQNLSKAYVTREVKTLDVDGEMTYGRYNDEETYGDVEFYCCAKCGLILYDADAKDVKSDDDLINWIREYRWSKSAI